MLQGLVLLILSAALVGCSVGKKDPRRDHREQAATTQDNPSIPADGKGAYYGLDLNAMYRLAQGASNDQRIQEVILPLASVILNEANLSDGGFKGHSQTNWALEFLDSQIIQSLKESPSDARLSQVGATYRGLLLEGCDPRAMTGCRHMAFFSRDPQLGGLLKKFALESKDVEGYFRMIKLAFEVQGDVRDAELEKLIYARMPEVLKTYINITSSGGVTRMTPKTLSDSQKLDLAGYTTFFSMALRSSSGTELEAGQALELLQWVSSNQLDAAVGRDLAFLISDLVSKQLSKPEMWEQFTGIFMRSEEAEDMSYTNAFKRLQAADSGMLARLGVKPYDLDSRVKSRSKDLAAVFFLSRVFDLRPPQREHYLWEMAKLTPEASLDLIEAFVKVTMVDQTLRTHQLLGEFYRTHIINADPQAFLPAAMDFSDQNLTPRWKDYVSRIQKIEEFFADEIERPLAGQKGTPISEKIQHVRNMFEELNPNIKYMATYPNMIMLAYYAAKVNLNMWVGGPSGERIQINKDVIMHDVMEGQMPPLFRFTSFKAAEAQRNQEKLDSVQMLWALYFAVAMDVPGIYGVDTQDFLRTLLETYKAPTDKRLREIITSHEELLRPQSDIQRLMGICQAPDGAAGVFNNVLPIEVLSKTTFLGELADTSIAPLRAAVTRVNLPNTGLKGSFDEAIELLRSDVDPKLRRLYLVKSAFKQGKNPDLQALQQIDGMLNETIGLRQRVLGSSRTLINSLLPCVMKMHDFEEQRRRELIDMEIGYVRHVQTALQTVGSAANERAGLERLRDGDAFFAALDVNLGTEQALNAVFAAATHLESAFQKTANYRQDFTSQGGFQRETSGRLIYNYRRTDLIVRIALYLNHGFEGRTVSNHMDNVRVILPATLKDLLTRIGRGVFSPIDLQLYNQPGDRIQAAALKQFSLHITWLGDRASLTPVYRSILRMSTALLKYESLGTLDLEVQVACDAACESNKNTEAKAGIRKLLDLSNHMLETLSLRDGDVQLLGLFSSNTFYNFRNDTFVKTVGPKTLFMDTRYASELIGLGDEVFMYLTSIRLGFDPLFRGLREFEEMTWMLPLADEGGRAKPVILADALITRGDPYQRALKYYRTLKDKQNLLLFDIPTLIDQQITLFHTILIRTDIKLAQSFDEAAAEWDRETPRGPSQFQVRAAPELIKVVTPTLVGNYRSKMKKFHDETLQVFQ